MRILITLLIYMYICSNTVYSQSSASKYDEYISLIKTQKSKDMYNEALETCNKAIKEFPKEAEFYAIRAEILFGKGKNSEAISNYDKAINLTPYNVNYYYLRAIVKEDISDYNGAIEDCSLAIKQQPAIPMLYEKRGYNKLRLKDSAGAYSDWLIAQQKGSTEATKAINKYFHSGKPRLLESVNKVITNNDNIQYTRIDSIDIYKGMWPYREFRYYNKDSRLIRELVTDLSHKNFSKIDYIYTKTMNSSESSKWNSTKLCWENEERHTTSFLGNKEVAESFVWDLELLKWNNSERTEKLYRSKDGREEYVSYTWDSQTKNWKGKTKTQEVYDKQSNKIMYSSFKWSTVTNNWINDTKNEYSYNTTHDLTDEINSKWDNTSNTWKYVSKSHKEYNSNRKITLKDEISWDDKKKDWFITEHTVNTYDSMNRLASTYFAKPVILLPNKPLQNQFKHEYSYDSNNKIIKDYTYKWNDANNEWEYFSVYDNSTSKKTILYWDRTNKKWKEQP